MRPGLLIALLALALAAPARADPPPGWTPQARVAQAYAQQRTGTIAFAVRTEQRLWGHDAHRRMRSASVVKALLMAAYLNRRDVRRRALRAAERALLAPMVRASDNDAATSVLTLLGPLAVEGYARRVGMRHFRLDPWWGHSDITAADQTRFFLELDRYLPARHRAYGMRLLRTIVPEQRWGIGRAAPPGWRLYFKGGWGSGRGLVDHQVALLRRGELRVALAVLTVGGPTHAYRARTLKSMFRRLVRGL